MMSTLTVSRTASDQPCMASVPHQDVVRSRQWPHRIRQQMDSCPGAGTQARPGERRCADGQEKQEGHRAEGGRQPIVHGQSGNQHVVPAQMRVGSGSKVTTWAITSSRVVIDSVPCRSVAVQAVQQIRK